MNERDRLIELLRTEIPTECDNHEDCIGCPYEFDVEGCFKSLAVSTADHLLANGVSVLPCEEGDTLYALCTDGNILECVVDKIQISILVGWQLSTMRFNVDNFSRYFFFTRDEAEQALKAREKE